MAQVLIILAISIVLTSAAILLNVGSREQVAEFYRDANLSIASDRHWAQDRFIITSEGGLEALQSLSGVTPQSGDSSSVRVPASSFPELEEENEVTVNGRPYILKKTLYLKKFPNSPNKVDYLLVENDYFDKDTLVFSKPRVLSR